MTVTLSITSSTTRTRKSLSESSSVWSWCSTSLVVERSRVTLLREAAGSSAGDSSLEFISLPRSRLGGLNGLAVVILRAAVPARLLSYDVGLGTYDGTHGGVRDEARRRVYVERDR